MPVDGTVELSVQLDRAGAPHDVARLIYGLDVAYELFLRAKLRRHAELQREDERRQKSGG